MVLEKKDLDGSETAVTAGREPLEMEDKVKYRVALRGAGTYEGGQKKDFQTEELMDEKIKNASLVVCNPDDVEEVYVVSAPVDSVLGKSILSMQHKDENGVQWLNPVLLNAVGDLGVEEVKTKESYNKGYKKMYWNQEVKKGKPVYLKGELPAETVGAEQKGSMDVEGEEGEVVM